MIYVQMPIGVESRIYNVRTNDRIIKEVIRYFDITEEKLRSRSRLRLFAFARMCCYFLLRKHTNYSYLVIGSFFGRDHSTVIVALNHLSDLMDTDEMIRKTVLELDKNISE